MIVKFLEWVVNRYVKKDSSEKEIELEAIMREKAREEPDKEEQILRFVKELSHRNEGSE